MNEPDSGNAGQPVPTDPAEEKRVETPEPVQQETQNEVVKETSVTERQEVSTDDVADAAEVLGSPETDANPSS